MSRKLAAHSRGGLLVDASKMGQPLFEIDEEGQIEWGV